MPQVHIPASLRPHVDNQTVVSVEGETVGDLLQKLFEQFPNLKAVMMSQSQQVHPFFNLFVDQDNIRDLQQLDTLVATHQEVLIVPALAGG